MGFGGFRGLGFRVWIRAWGLGFKWGSGSIGCFKVCTYSYCRFEDAGKIEVAKVCLTLSLRSRVRRLVWSRTFSGG